ncbi:hypothetical protein T459_24683 [Capsicum annuum]|uniref:Cell differentiation protein RCD1 homolog n=1 Tax=Capsicum annuum TaxID=4072 RepID=A0A2G2YIN8_CAPAN|nr:hypothetical protein T459_24683 [Capsicum annuum]
MSSLPQSLLLVINGGDLSGGDGGGGASSSSGAGALANRDWRMQLAEWLILDLLNPDLWKNALLELSKKRELFHDLGLVLWNSFGTPTVFLQVLRHSLGVQINSRDFESQTGVCSAKIPFYLYPFLDTTSESRPFEYLRLTSLGVIGALVKADDTDVIRVLLPTQIIQQCLRAMQMGSELSKTVSVSPVPVSNSLGLSCICTTPESFFAVVRVLGNMVGALAEQPSSSLLKHIIRCYLRLSYNRRACDVLRTRLPLILRDTTFSSRLSEDHVTKKWLQQLLHNVDGNRRIWL